MSDGIPKFEDGITVEDEPKFDDGVDLEPSNKMSGAKIFQHGVEQGVTMGGADELAGGVQGFLDDLSYSFPQILPDNVKQTPNQVTQKLVAEGFTGDLKDTYTSGRDDARQLYKDAQDQSDGEYFAGNLVGGALTAFTPGGVGKLVTTPFGAAKPTLAAIKAAELTATKAAPTLLAKMGYAAANAAPAGAAIGYGTSEANNTTDALIDTATGGATGAVIGGALPLAGATISKVGDIGASLFPDTAHAYRRGIDEIKTYGDSFNQYINNKTSEVMDPVVGFFENKKNLNQTSKTNMLSQVDDKIKSLEAEVNTKNVDKLAEIENQINEYKQLRSELQDEYKGRHSTEKQLQIDQNNAQVQDVKFKLDDAKTNKRLSISDEIAENEKKIANLNDDYKYQLEQTKKAQLSNNKQQLAQAEEKARQVANDIQNATEKTLDDLGKKYDKIDDSTKTAGIKFKLRNNIRQVLDGVNDVNPEAYDQLSKQFEPFTNKIDLTVDEIRMVIGRAEEAANQLKLKGSSSAARSLMKMRGNLREAQLATYADAGMKNIAKELLETNAQYSKTVSYRDYLKPNEVTRQIENQKELIRKVQSFKDYDPNLPLHDSNQFINEISQALPEQAPGIVNQAKAVGQQLKGIKDFSPELSGVQVPDVNKLQGTIDQLKRAKIDSNVLPESSQAKQYQDLINEYENQLNNLKQFKPDVDSKVLSPDADLLGFDNKILELKKSKGDKIDLKTLQEYQDLMSQKSKIEAPTDKTGQYDKFLDLAETDKTSINKWLQANKVRIIDPLNEQVDTVELKKLIAQYETETGKKVTQDLQTLVKDIGLVRSSEEGAKGASFSSIGGIKSIAPTLTNITGKTISSVSNFVKNNTSTIRNVVFDDIDNVLNNLKKFRSPEADLYASQIEQATQGSKQTKDALTFSLMQQPQFRRLLQKDKGNESKP